MDYMEFLQADIMRFAWLRWYDSRRDWLDSGYWRWWGLAIRKDFMYIAELAEAR